MIHIRPLRSVIFLTISFLYLSRSYGQTPDWYWARSSNGNGIGSKSGKSVSTDAAGNIYVSGSFSTPTITFGAFTLTNNSNTGDLDIFLVKYNSIGNVLWAKSIGAESGESGESVVADNSGHVYMTGYFFSHTITFGSTTLTNHGPTTGWLQGQEFLAKFDSSGNVLWAKTTSETLESEAGGTSLATDASGNVYEAGYFWSPTLHLGSVILTNVGPPGATNDMFLAKYDPAGNVLWAKSAGGQSKDICYSVSADASGAVYITGKTFSPIVTFGNNTVATSGMYDGFIAKYDASTGYEVWSQAIGGTNIDIAHGISGDGTGNVYATGYFYSPSITIGNTILSNPDSSKPKLFLAKYDVAGNAIWANTTTGPSGGQSLITDGAGDIYLLGLFSDSITLGTNTLLSTYNINDIANYHLFIAKYSATGIVLWAKDAGGSNNDMGECHAMDAAGNIFITGSFTSPTITFGADSLTNTTAGNSKEMFLARLGSNSTLTNINEMEIKHIIISPNPNNGNFSLLGNVPANAITAKVMVTDIFGKLIYSTKSVINLNSLNEKIELNDILAPGTYFLKVTTGNEARTIKFTVD